MEISRRVVFVALLIIASAIAGCSKKKNKESATKKEFKPRFTSEALVATKLAAPSVNATAKFTLLDPKETGVDFQNEIDDDHSLNRLYHSGFACGGVAIGDVDGDGRVDLFFVSGPRQNRLYRQVGEFKFEDITTGSGIDDTGRWGAGATMVDIDNDLDMDIYVCNYEEPNELYINAGDGTFEEKAEEFGLAISDSSLMAYFADYDNDGNLDLFLLTNRLYHPKGRPSNFSVESNNYDVKVNPELARYFRLKMTDGKFSLVNIGRKDYLFRNTGDKFEDVSKKAGIVEDGHGLSALWWDYDRDGFQDLYVCNDFEDADCFYRNNHDGTFSNVILDRMKHTTWQSMGSDSADVNNDGWADLFCVDMAATTHYKSKVSMGDIATKKNFLDTAEPRQYMRNFLHINTGTGKFLESAPMSGVASTDWSWAARLFDLDCDGLVDIFVTNGHVRNFGDSDVANEAKSIKDKTDWQVYEKAEPLVEKNAAFVNQGDFRFQRVDEQWGLDLEGLSYAAGTADLDNDGDLDLIVVNLEQPVSIYRNDLAQKNRITVGLQGNRSNSHGLGATVKVTTDAGQQIRTLSPQTGFLSSNEPIIQFGLGEQSKIRELSVQWSSGIIQKFDNLATNSNYTITEVGEPVDHPAPPINTSKLFEAFENNFDSHQEVSFDDFALQLLLPNKLSQLGPGVAVADVNGDGHDDVYFSAPKLQKPRIFINDGTGNFKAKKLSYSEDELYEDLGALFFDCDGDGDLDLYVVSGSVEHGKNEKLINDRLYINDGKGNFDISPDALPDAKDSGSVVTAADFDQDGDLDLFIGGRVLTGQYPMSPNSRLLRNESSDGKPKFVDVTESVCQELQTPGMVTSALWSDVNNDGWIDLLLTLEWGAVKVFMNSEGKLTDHTQQSGLGGFSGWWNGICGRDFDNDGDIDYAVTNFGLNTKYHVTKKKPATIYYGVFGDSKTPQIIEAKVGDQCMLPVRGKSCSQSAMPFISDKFEKYKDFASATLTDIYTPTALESARKFETNYLSSSVLLNDGTGNFEIVALPQLVQISPGFGIVATDYDGDGICDLYVAQNFYTPQRETSRMAGGTSVLLKGNGDGSFKPVWPFESGLIVAGDAKGLAISDLNNDNKPDFLLGINNSKPSVFLNNNAANSFVAVRLVGEGSNVQAIGARVTLELSDGSKQTAEVAAGGSYLSQSTDKLFFGTGGSSVKKISVRWPDGSTSSSEEMPENGVITLAK